MGILTTRNYSIFVIKTLLFGVLFSCSLVSSATLFHNYHRISTPDRIAITSQSDQVRFTDSGILVLSDDANTVRGNALNSHGNARGAGILFKYFKPTNGYVPGQDPINIGLRLLFSSTCHSMFVMWRIVDPGVLGEGVYIQVRKSDGINELTGECENPKYRHFDSDKLRIAVPNSALDNKIHSLRADISGDAPNFRLRIRVDDSIIFDQIIDDPSLLYMDKDRKWLEGTSGFRADNGVFHIGVFDRYHED